MWSLSNFGHSKMAFGVYTMVLFSLLISRCPVLVILWSPKKTWESIIFWLIFIFLLGRAPCVSRL